MAASRGVLRAVGNGDHPVPEVLSLTEAIATGDYVKILRAQRRDIVKSLEAEKGPALAALHRQLSMISKEIETLESRPDPAGAGARGAVDDSFDASAI